MPPADPPIAPTEELRRLDAEYPGLPEFSSWSQIQVPESIWGQAQEILARSRAAAQKAAYDELVEQSMRAAAIDSGAIEGLYGVDRGFTMSVVAMASAWEAEIEREKGSQVAALVAAQRSAYDLALDAATAGTEMSEVWIRQLHQTVCAAQDTYIVHTEVGRQEHALPKGEYKQHSNSVRQADGSMHSYAPVSSTGPEMHRLVEALREPEFRVAHPVLQAAYAHYGLVTIHPFADGNGRVARVLASVYLLRALSLPLVVYADQKDAYLDALAAADAGRPQQFVDFVLARVVEVQLYLAEALRAEAAPEIETSAERLARIVVPPEEGPTDEELDTAAQLLLRSMAQALHAVLQGHDFPPQLDWRGHLPILGLHDPPGFRRLGHGWYAEIRLSIPTSREDTASVSELLGVLLRLEPGSPLPIRIEREGGGDVMDLRVEDMYPRVTEGLQRRLNVWARRIVSEALDRLAKAAEQATGD